jgi:hypothetical protein
MVDTVDLCDDGPGPRPPNAPPRNQLCHGAQPWKHKTMQPTQPTETKTALRHPNSSTSTPSSSGSDCSTLQYPAYSESFYIDFIASIEHAFPWQTFAIRNTISANDLRHMFFVLVILPLSDPEDNSKRLKVAQGARRRFSEWRQAWEETVAKIKAERAEIENAEEQEGYFGRVRSE